jgi:hypothetical protein
MSATTVSAHLITDQELLDSGVKLRQDGPDLSSPTVGGYYVIDNDAKTCRMADATEFNETYVDKNIATFRLQDFSPFEETLDNENLIATYSSGAQATIRFGLIDVNASGSPTDLFAKSDGLIYPIDESGSLVLNKTNTPVLAATRAKILEQWEQAGEDNVKMAELVEAFVKNGIAPVSGLSGIQ